MKVRYDTLVFYESSTGVFHREPDCARGRTFIEDPALEIHGGSPDLSALSLVRGGELPDDADLCKTCVKETVRSEL